MLLQVQTLTTEAWAPFGWLPVRDTDPGDGTQTLEFRWGDPHLNVISHGPEEIERDPSGVIVSRMYRHDTHTQALMALNCSGIVAVAPAELQFRRADDLAAIRVFAVEPLAPLVLHRGTWHWGPFPTGPEPILLLNVQGRRYIEDNTCADVAAVGSVVVAPPA
jgi:ureidoglycolate hydrolase